MTDTELSALEAAAKAATPGPWTTHGRNFVVSIESRNNPIIVCDCLERKDAKYVESVQPAAILEMIAELRQARADACEWINIARWLARELGKDSIPETEWIILARQALGYKNEWVDDESQNGFRIYSALEDVHLQSNSCSILPQGATCQKN